MPTDDLNVFLSSFAAMLEPQMPATITTVDAKPAPTAKAVTKSGAPSNRREKIAEGTLCVVCGDFASGIHYSVASCNGCKTFFRRAIVNKQTFTCQFANQCLVGKNVRCVCRACRLQKCYDTGMDTKAIQHDRDKIRYTKILKRQRDEMMAAQKDEDTIDIKDEVQSPQDGSNDCNEGPSSSKNCVVVDLVLQPEEEVMTDVTAMVKLLADVEEKIVKLRTAHRFDVHTSSTWNMYSDCLLKDKDWVRTHSVALPQTQNSDRCSLLDLRRWFNRELTLMMEWVKALPDAQEMLLNDKAALMKGFACAYPVMQLAYYSKDQTVYSSNDNNIPAGTKISSTSASISPAPQLLPEGASGAKKKAEVKMEDDCGDYPGTSQGTLDKLEKLDEPITIDTVDDDECPSDPTPTAQVINRLYYPDGLYVERDPGNAKPDELYMMMIDGVWRMLRVNDVDSETFVLYKLLLFFNTDVEGLSCTGRQKVTKMRTKLLDYLYIFLTQKRGRQGHLVYANLLMLSATNSRISHVIRKLFTIDHLFGPSNDLVDQLVLAGL